MAKLANYKIHALKEKEDARVDVTSYPVEKGLPTTDNVNSRPIMYSISGKILRNDANDADKVRDNLKKKMFGAKRVKYIGRIKASDVLITSISSNYSSSIKNGLDVDITMQQIRVAKTPYVRKKTKKSNSGKKTKIKKKSTSRKYHTVRPGDTYWGLSRKYGTSISQLRKWNKYPDRKIPVGAKLRVK